VIAGINFKRNSADIAPTSFPLLKQAVQVLKEYPTLKIEISGHTSDEGKRDFNMKLSEKRAQAVKAYLVKQGIDPKKVQTAGMGKTKPVADNKTGAGRAKNRRVEVEIRGTRTI
jgi:OOP family OmpA-OmpF porin